MAVLFEVTRRSGPHMNSRQLLSIALSAGLVTSTASVAGAASRITTTDGAVITGDVERLQDDIYSIRTRYGIQKVPKQDVRKIEPTDSTGAEGSAQCANGGNCPPVPVENRPLRFSGSNTIGAELVPNLLEAYARSLGSEDVQWISGTTPEDRSLKAKVASGATFEADVSAHGSGNAPTALIGGKADVGMMSREINKEEIAKVEQAGLGNILSPSQQHVLALDGLLVLVQRDNPVTRLTLDDIAAIYAGEKTDWADFGGKAGPIVVFRRADGSGTLDTFNALVMKKKKFASSVKAIESSTDLSDAVASDPKAIGFVGIAYARSARPLEIALECGLSYKPSEFLVKTEEYPLSRRLFLYNAAVPANPATMRFVDYALSARAQPVIAKNQFIDLLIDRSDPTYGDGRIADALRNASSDPVKVGAYARMLAGSNRLSVTFRFTSGGSDLDARAVRDIDRLSEFLKEPVNRNRSVMLLGHADARGSSARNCPLSQSRANQVAEGLIARGVPGQQIKPTGLCSFAPVACDGSKSTPNEDGMKKNRRVEVWVR